MNYKIDNRDKLYTCDKYGNTGRKISDSVAFATFDDSTETFLVTGLDGRVQTRDKYGNPIRIICENANEARFSGSDIIVRSKNGRTEQRDKYGFLIRNI